MDRDGGDFEPLIAGARRGDGDSISAIYKRHQPALLRVIRAEVGDAADDVASQAWLETMAALRRFQGDERGFRALLFTIARRRVADHRRRERRRPAVPLAPVDIEALLDERSSVDVEVLSGLRSDDAIQLMSAVLGPDQVQIVLLRVIAGLSVDEVAAVMGRAPGTVRVQQHRALSRLAAVLSRDGSDVF